MRELRRAVVVGKAFGLAVAIVEMSLGARHMMNLRMPPTPETMILAAVLEIALGGVLAAVLLPLRRLPRGTLLHVAAIAAVWTGLERYLSTDPARTEMWLTGPLAGLLLLGLGALIARRRPLLPWAAGLLALAATILVPVVDHQRNRVPEATVSAVAPASSDAPDVVLVVLDTVRAQSMSTYGYERPTSPRFTELAGQGLLFLDATSPSTWSLPSHASLFTGRFPSSHNAHGEHRILGPELPTLAETFARAGYDTRCFTANPHISDSFGLTRGFAWSDRAWASGGAGRQFVFAFRLLDLIGLGPDDKGGARVAGNFERWQADRARDDRPAFVFINFLEAHFPYHHVPQRFLREFTDLPMSELRDISLRAFGAQFGRRLDQAQIERMAGPSRDMYDAGVRYSDYLLGRIVDAVAAAGRLDRTVFIVLADHGEMVGEHGDFGHGASLYQPDIHVPLLVRYPPAIAGGTRVERPVSTLGVYATAVELAGIEKPSGLQVGSLAAAAVEPSAGLPVIAERFASEVPPLPAAPLARRELRYRVYRAGSYKLAETSEGAVLLFDLAADPGEERDLAADEPRQREPLAQALQAWTAALGLPAITTQIDFGAVPQIDPAAAERLEALGYAE